MGFQSSIVNWKGTPAILSVVEAQLPANAVIGTLGVTTDTLQLKRWDGAAWQTIGGGTTTAWVNGGNNFSPASFGTIGAVNVTFKTNNVTNATMYGSGANVGLWRFGTSGANDGFRVFINGGLKIQGLVDVSLRISPNSRIQGGDTTGGLIYIDASQDNTGTVQIRATSVSIFNANGITSGNALKTGSTAFTTAQFFKVGSVVNAAVALDATKYVDVEIAGTAYKLALVS